jgi:bifunctional lysine-specific demethylase and histidyl-hydroxylase NO66
MAKGGAAPHWREDALAFLIAPTTREAFFADSYEQAPLLSQSGDPERFAELLTLARLDAFIAGADLREGMLDLAHAETRPERGDYVDARGDILRTVVADQYTKGATVILPQLQESIPELGLFCRALEEVFSAHLQTNVYLTPPGHQGFPIHYDNHDVFVLQLSGRKAWRLYDQPVGIPYRGEGFALGDHAPGPLAAAFTLAPGDCLYVPRGLMHDAQNDGDAPSLHITVGLITKTWADLMLEAVSELALEEPDFRRSLPPGFAARDFDRSDAQTHFQRLIGHIAKRARMDGAFELIGDNHLRARRPDVSGVFAAPPPVPQPGATYRRRRYVPWTVAEDDDGKLALIGPGGDILFDPADGDALDIALSGAPFTPEALPAADPAELVRRLWAGGYLERG